LTPLLMALARPLPTMRVFGMGLLAGILYFGGTLYWITHVMALYGGLSLPVAVLINAALVAYLALFPAAFTLIVQRLAATAGPTALLSAPVVWTATELGRTYLFTGFPWVLLGYSQVDTLPVAQLASQVGVYGLSALVALVGASLAFAAVGPRQFSGDGRMRYVPLVGAVSLVLAVAAWGSMRIADGRLTRAGERIRVGLVQGNVDQGIKWNPALATSIFDGYLGMTRQAMREGADLVIWPESSTPFYFEEDRPNADRLRLLAREAGIPILLGSDQVERGVPIRFYNSAFLVDGDGTVGGVYRKMHLVPFGEYVPFKRLLFFAGPLVEAVSDFSAGESAVLLPVRGHKISTSICYEIVYPDLVRQFVRGGSELLTTITNDAWFGRTSAPHQHFAQAAMRAIEEGRYLVRSANTGISGIVDPYGRVLERSPLFQPAVVVGEARFLKEFTTYTRIGDAFAYASVVATLALGLLVRRRVQ
jgi:apolipoprotein N-acyltransferase